ncbi:MAG TPA: hypothetical protein VFV73_04820 [Streptosporangiaceae bacterium]|nr:hypothetical protein [Streptosporangiaceae bacterium]
MDVSDPRSAEDSMHLLSRQQLAEQFTKDRAAAAASLRRARQAARQRRHRAPHGPERRAGAGAPGRLDRRHGRTGE